MTWRYTYSQTKQKHIHQHINNSQQQLRLQPIFCTSFILTLLHSVYVCNFRLFASCPISLPATLNTWSTFLILGLAYFYCDLTFDFIYIHISLFSGVIVFLLFIYRFKINVVLRKTIKFISKVCIIWHKCFSQSKKVFFFIQKFQILSVNGVLHAFISMWNICFFFGTFTKYFFGCLQLNTHLRSKTVQQKIESVLFFSESIKFGPCNAQTYYRMMEKKNLSYKSSIFILQIMCMSRARTTTLFAISLVDLMLTALYIHFIAALNMLERWNSIEYARIYGP